MLSIKEGFEFEEFKYGFKKGTLFRLPSTKNGRYYPIKEVPRIKLSATSEGYRLCRMKKSITQVHSMLEKVNWKYPNINCKECL